MKPASVKLHNHMADIAKWMSRTAWLIPVVGLIVGFSFYLQEPVNDDAVELAVLTGFYLGWGIFGLRGAIWGLAGIMTKRLMFQNLEMALSPVHSEGEMLGWKAVAVGLLAIILSLITFIIPGFFLGLGPLIFLLLHFLGITF